MASAMASARIMGDYRILYTLGSGVQGKVKKAQRRDGAVVALKIVRKAKLRAESSVKLRREVQAMQTCNHPNITKLNKVDWNFLYVKKDGTKIPCVMMELEFAEGGELFDFLNFTGSFPEPIARTYFRQLVDGIMHCHSKGVSHRDVKAENLLLDKTFRLKIADFGLSAIHDCPTWLETQCGTKGYMAPEILAKRRYDGVKADVWSMGVVLFIMLTGFPPFQCAEAGDWWFERIVRSQYKHFWDAHLRNAVVSDAARDLLDKIFVADPSRRATLQQIACHPWCRDKVLTPEVIQGELSRRKAKVEKEKRAEKMQKRLKKEGAGHFDPDREKFRVVRTISESPPPIPAEGVPHFTSFRVNEDATEIVSRLEQALSKLSATTKVSVGYKLKATVTTPSGAVSATIQIFSDKDTHVVELRRRRGNTLKFQQFYKSICDDLADIIWAE